MLSEMDTRVSYAAGIPSWVDVGVADIPQAIAFYEALFGWARESEPNPEFGGYTVMTQQGKRVAGISPKGDPNDPNTANMPDYWGVSIAVDDTEATVAKVERAGGRVIYGAMPVGDLGVMAVIQDTQDTFVTMWQAGSHPGCELVNTPNSFVWNELATSNLRGSAEFYSRVFGMAIDSRRIDDGSVGFYVGGNVVCGAHALRDGEFPAWSVWFAVADVDAMAGRVCDLGGSVFTAPFDTEWGRSAILAAPGGAVFGIVKV